MRIAWIFTLFLPVTAWAAEGTAPPPAGTAQESAPPERCNLFMNIGWFARQDVTIKPGRVIGPDFNLHVEDDVVYGFIRGRTTRFRVGQDRISGSAAGFDLMLHLSQTATTTKIRGLVGNRRVTAAVTDQQISISAAASAQVNAPSSLSVSRVGDGYFRGHVGGGADLQFADLTLKGCELTLIRERPDLIVALFMCWLGS